jgi:hypothetical protein
MSENDTQNSGGIEGFSADYRNAHPPKPKAERPAPRQSAPKQSASNKSAPKQPARNSTAKNASSARPKAEKKRVSKPLPKASMENENELDDFLPEGEKNDVESYLTKWDEEEKPPVSVHTDRQDRQLRRSGKYRYGLFTGFLVLLLALVGVVFIAVTAGQRIHSALTDDSKLRAYDQEIAVVVAQDPEPFESPDKADEEFVLNASIWKLMIEHSSDYTTYDDIGRTVVPLGDVAEACEELFGPDCTLHPQSPKTESFYTYDSEKAQFHIALYSQEGVYTPYTVNAKKEGDSVVLRVGYVPPTDATRAASSSVSSGAEKPTPAKYMDYVIKTNEKTRKDYIYAVRKAS